MRPVSSSSSFISMSFLLLVVSLGADGGESTVCSDGTKATSGDGKEEVEGGDKAPPATTLYVITATYRQRDQLPSLLRLSQTLSLVRALVWVVAEETEDGGCSPSVERGLAELAAAPQLGVAHLAAKAPKAFR